MILRFADCILDPDCQSLRRGGARVAVEPQVFALIRLLAENAERMVTRDEMIKVVWGGRVLSESAISSRIAAARKAVGDDGRRQAVIRTIHRRGLQMAVPVTSGPAVQPVAAPPAARIRFARADDGAMLAYAIDGTGPPATVVANFMTDLEKERQVAGLHELYDALTVGNRVLRFDQRGAGLSDRRLDRVDIGETAEDLRAVLDAAELDRTALFALSSGALTALTFAALYPARVTRMVVVGGYVDGRLRRVGQIDPASDPIRGLYDEGWQDPQSVLMTACMTAYLPDGSGDLARGIAAHFQASTSRENILAFRDAINVASVGHCLSRIACPVLVIHARHDRIHPIAEAQKLAAGIPKAELLVLESGNHIPLPGQPGWSNYLNATLAFLRG